MRLSLFRTANILQIWHTHVHLYCISLVLTPSEESLKSTHGTNIDFFCVSVHMCAGTMLRNRSEDFFSY